MKNSKYYPKYPALSNAMRIIAADAIEKAKSGHPGMVLGMADIMTIVAFEFLKFNPKDPKWFNRDRLVLSAGHGSMLLYSFYYLAGYKDFTLDDIKSFRMLHSKTPGHPEYGTFDAVETTTGPLGAGFANSVGMAIAQKKYQDRLGTKICDYKIYCIVGDGCLMEGISYEAASLAGHLKLDNLIVIFDDNKISIDGPTSLTISEDQLSKFKSLGWNVEAIDGHSFEEISSSLLKAQVSDKPYFIACRTSIAKGSVTKEGLETTHGSPLGRQEISLMKQNLSFRDEEFAISPELKNMWEEAHSHSQESYDNWQGNFLTLSEEDKDYMSELRLNIDFLKAIEPTINDEATRISSGKIIAELLKNNDKIISGSADLSISNNIKNPYSKIITKDDFSGNFIHYGIRESAMCGIMNGVALSGFLPIGSTFLVFSDYMRPGIRLAALMKKQVIYIMTHDSIGIGEDGATHQPVEHLASFRAMPNILVMRPADFTETLECFEIALCNIDRPSVLALTRQSLPKMERKFTNQNLSAKGAYIVYEPESGSDVTIFASGSELSIALKVADILLESNIKLCVVSVVCFELFFEQDPSYVDSILQRSKFNIAIEAATSFGWHRIIGARGKFFGVENFGISAPSDQIYKYLKLTPEDISDEILLLLKQGAV